MAKAGRGAARVRRTATAWGYGDTSSSLVFIFPVLLAYEVGVLFSPTLNGVDFITRLILAAVDGDRGHYLMVHAGLAVVYVGYLLYLRSKKAFELRAFLPMLLESCIYALTLGTLIVFIMNSLFGILDSMSMMTLVPASLGGLGQKVVTSMGAGVHEELVFRIGLFGGGTFALERFGVSRFLAVLASLLLSSVLFSLAHHIGPLGDSFELGVFTYRFLAGVIFALIFYYRSLAHAVYTHFLYDVYVLVFHP